MFRPFARMRIRLDVGGSHLPLLDEGLMHLLAMPSCSLLPIRHGALIHSIAHELRNEMLTSSESA